jgi:hypothetical protein
VRLRPPIHPSLPLSREKASPIITFNQSQLDGGDTLADPILAAAILGRLQHGAARLNIGGEGYHLKERWCEQGIIYAGVLRRAQAHFARSTA